MLLTFLDNPLTPQFLHRYMEADAVSDLAFNASDGGWRHAMRAMRSVTI
jgi:hypothetical protein